MNLGLSMLNTENVEKLCNVLLMRLMTNKLFNSMKYCTVENNLSLI